MLSGLKPQNPGVTGNTVYPVSAGDGWARISTIKMLSHPSGQEMLGEGSAGAWRVGTATEGGCPDLKVTGKWNVRGCSPVWVYPMGRDSGGGGGSRGMMVHGASVLSRITGDGVAGGPGSTLLMLSYVLFYIPRSYYTRCTSP